MVFVPNSIPAPKVSFPPCQPQLSGHSVTFPGTGWEKEEQLRPEWKTGWRASNLEADVAEADDRAPASAAH